MNSSKGIRRDTSFSPSTAQEIDDSFIELRRSDKPYRVTRNYTFKDTDQISTLHVNTTAGNITITLPSPTGSRRCSVIKTDASANTVTVTSGANLINGTASHVLSVRYGNITVEPTGTSWYIVGWNTQVLISGGSIDGTPIGVVTPSTGAFTTLSATGLSSNAYGLSTGPLAAYASASGGIYSGFTGGAAFIRSVADNSGTAAPLQLQSGNGTTIASATSTGLAVTGVLSSTGNINAISVKTTTYTITAIDHCIVGNHATVAFTVTLVAASSNTGRSYVFKNKGIAVMTIDATGLGQFFTTVGVNTIAIATGDAYTVISDGTTWLIV